MHNANTGIRRPLKAKYQTEINVCCKILAQTAGKIPNAQHAVVPNAGHISNLENPVDFNDQLKNFLNRHQGIL